MNANPTSGPIRNRSTHHARAALSSRHSFPSNHHQLALRERKKYLFERPARIDVVGARRELLERSFAAHNAAAQQHEPVTHARRVANLMDRQEQRAAPAGVRAQSRSGIAGLAKIEAVE